ncbi:hypothetical protein ON010_g76 [Phytophthora cinnamomi]|nr:hypothetical protein ON010_g76 [Phytophthora cinnamomi]
MTASAYLGGLRPAQRVKRVPGPAHPLRGGGARRARGERGGPRPVRAQGVGRRDAEALGGAQDAQGHDAVLLAGPADQPGRRAGEAGALGLLPRAPEVPAAQEVLPLPRLAEHAEARGVRLVLEADGGARGAGAARPAQEEGGAAAAGVRGRAPPLRRVRPRRMQMLFPQEPGERVPVGGGDFRRAQSQDLASVRVVRGGADADERGRQARGHAGAQGAHSAEHRVEKDGRDQGRDAQGRGAAQPACRRAFGALGAGLRRVLGRGEARSVRIRPEARACAAGGPCAGGAAHAHGL